jgi:exonuclease SbcD
VSDAQERITIAINRHNLREAVVRLELQATREQRDQLNEEQLRQQLREAGAFVIAAININVERTARRRIAGAEALLDGLTPRKALELYLKNKQPPLSAARIATLLAAADELMKETAP